MAIGERASRSFCRHSARQRRHGSASRDLSFEYGVADRASSTKPLVAAVTGAVLTTLAVLAGSTFKRMADTDELKQALSCYSW